MQISLPGQLQCVTTRFFEQNKTVCVITTPRHYVTSNPGFMSTGSVGSTLPAFSPITIIPAFIFLLKLDGLGFPCTTDPKKAGRQWSSIPHSMHSLKRSAFEHKTAVAADPHGMKGSNVYEVDLGSGKLAVKGRAWKDCLCLRLRN